MQVALVAFVLRAVLGAPGDQPTAADAEELRKTAQMLSAKALPVGPVERPALMMASALADAPQESASDLQKVAVMLAAVRPATTPDADGKRSIFPHPPADCQQCRDQRPGRCDEFWEPVTTEGCRYPTSPAPGCCAPPSCSSSSDCRFTEEFSYELEVQKSAWIVTTSSISRVSKKHLFRIYDDSKLVYASNKNSDSKIYLREGVHRIGMKYEGRRQVQASASTVRPRCPVRSYGLCFHFEDLVQVCICQFDNSHW